MARLTGFLSEENGNVNVYESNELSATETHTQLMYTQENEL